MPRNVRLVEHNVVIRGAPNPNGPTAHWNAAKVTGSSFWVRCNLFDTSASVPDLNQRLAPQRFRFGADACAIDVGAIARPQIRHERETFRDLDPEVMPRNSGVLKRQGAVRIAA
jgi:hypothetical protein